MNADLFFEAVEAGSTDTVAALLDAEPSLLESRNGAGLSPVLAAAYRGHAAVIALLRERGARLDLCDAAAAGDTDRIHALLAAGADASAPLSADGWTPLHLACYFGHADAAARLLDAGADVRAWSENATRNTPLHAALAGTRDASLITRLMDAGADLNAAGEGGYTPLHLAAARGDVGLIEALLARGARATLTNDGRTPADLATQRGHAPAAERLRDVPVSIGPSTP